MEMESVVDTLTVPAPVRERLGNAGSDGLVMMFAEAHRMATESANRTVREAEERFAYRLNDEISKFRVEMVERIGDLRFDILKWNFLFWIGQLAALMGLLSFLLRNVR